MPTPVKMSSEQALEENAYTLGVQAFLWGFPLHVYGELIPGSLKAGGTFLNDFHKFTDLKTAKDRFIVTPNNVTIDSYCNFDVTNEPLALFVPNLSAPRWYIVQIGDSFDEVIRNVGGIKGEQPGVYLITGPDFVGSIPGEMTQVKSRTRVGALGVRVFVNGTTDLPQAREVQNGFFAIPLSAYLRYGLGYKSPAERPTVLAYESSAPEDIRYFDELGYWMQRQLSVASDSDDTEIASFRQIGLSVSKGFQWQNLDDAAKRGLARAIVTGQQIVDSKWEAAGETTNGWKYTFAGGRAGFDSGLRAALAKYESATQISDQVIYPNTSVDEKGEPLTGGNQYVLHFDADKLPPVTVFWNMAMYASDMLFVENDFGRYSIGSTTDGLKKATDGSLTILIQKDPPADTANWLPSPAGNFNLTMRLYGPETSILNGSYRLPVVRKVE
ncbi:DUF1254 domain-containing protein [Granulicella sp. L46]|uniref:DUF1254 domain-containing protein n=1 Tax=Granulicella sp. L46 TaxID=1641865 RepID=UPI001C203270|nr:DUF1214 domain-containing protein [Granulicella sp. L46]